MTDNIKRIALKALSVAVLIAGVATFVAIPIIGIALVLTGLGVALVMDVALLALLVTGAVALLGFGMVSSDLGEAGVMRQEKATAREEAYRCHLQDCVKQAVGEIMKVEWADLLEKEGDSVKDRLQYFDPDLVSTLAAVSQVKELEGDDVCPRRFSGENLSVYNDRRHEVLALRRRYRKLEPADKKRLLEKLLLGSDFKLAGRSLAVGADKFQSLFEDITGLSAAIHQGRLMSVTS